MSSLLTYRDNLVTQLAALLSGVHVETHPGQVDLDEIRRMSTKSPYVGIAIDYTRGAVGNGLIEGKAMLVAFVVVKSTRTAKREGASERLTMLIARKIAAASGLIDCRVADSMEARNLYGSKLDSTGIALWSISWMINHRDNITDDNDVALLDDLLKVIGHHDIDQDQDPQTHDFDAPDDDTIEAQTETKTDGS